MFLLPAGVIFPEQTANFPLLNPADLLKEGAFRIGYSVCLPQPPRGVRLIINRRSSVLSRAAARLDSTRPIC